MSKYKLKIVDDDPEIPNDAPEIDPEIGQHNKETVDDAPKTEEELGQHNKKTLETLMRDGFTRLPKCALLDDELNPTSMVLLSVIFDHVRNRGTGLCYAKEETLAAEAGLSRESVQNHKKILRDKGWLDWQYSEGSMPRRCTYVLHIPAKLGYE